MMQRKCWICKGTGRVFEGDGWAAPTWTECSLCHGTGRYPFKLPCGCWSVEGLGEISGYVCREHFKQFPNATTPILEMKDAR